MSRQSFTKIAHQLILEHLQNNQLSLARYSIDATCGNGHDTEFLARHTDHQVFGFDIQELAIQATQQRINEANLSHKVSLCYTSHEKMIDLVGNTHPQAFHLVDIVMFNLGYLPNSDKSQTTLASSTLLALDQAIELLSPEGILSVICYQGHDGGKAESMAILSWLEKIKRNGFKYQIVEAKHKTEATPFLLQIKRQ